MITGFLNNLREEYSLENENIKSMLHNLQSHFDENNMRIIQLNQLNEHLTDNKSFQDNLDEIVKLQEEQDFLATNIENTKGRLYKIENKINELDTIQNERDGSVPLCGILDRTSKINFLDIQENERQRISRDLHDSTIQNLTSIILKTELCEKLVDTDPIRCKLELMVISKTIKEIVDDTRKMIYNLHPMSFDDIGFDVTVERFLNKLEMESSININFSIEGESFSVNPVIGITMLRIIQEACNNSLKYSHASIITVKISYSPGHIRIFVGDNGIGFDINNSKDNKQDNTGFGLSMMRERVYLLSGTINIDSKINEGTNIVVDVPIENKEEEKWQ